MTSELMIGGEAPRHLNPDTLDRLWSEGVPIVLPIDGTPDCRIRLDPAGSEVALITDYAPHEPDLAKLRNVDFRAYVDNDTDRAEIAVSVAENPRGAYALLTTVADGLQLRQAPLASAVAAGIDQHKEVLATRGRLSPEAELGLFGELLFVEHLLTKIETRAALDSWHGPLSEEHDFVLDHTHLEVKTTSGERRRHVIHGLTQLLPNPDMPLHLLSIQLTRAPRSRGVTLPALIARVRTASGRYAEKFDQRLTSNGWRPEDASMYQTSWTLRSNPNAYLIGDEFPAITPGRIEPMIPNFGLIGDVTYRVDVTGLQPTNGPEPLSSFVDRKDGGPA